MDRLLEAAPAWVERVGEIGLDERGTHRLAEMMTARLRELKGDG